MQSNQETPADAAGREASLAAPHGYAAVWRYRIAIACIICWLWGWWIGKGNCVIYVGDDQSKFERAAIGVLTK